jgi:hypothetical protein
LVKPAQISFTEGLEAILAGVWQANGDHLDDTLILKTRNAIVDVRTIYRNKGEKLIGEKIKRYSQSIDFTQTKYRAGYIASFGQRHAFLTYRHMQMVENKNKDIIPKPINGILNVTLIGAGAALELFGLCYYYNEQSHKIRQINLNIIERIEDWHSDRTAFIERLLKRYFSKLKVITRSDIRLNLIEDGISYLSHDYDVLADSDIILVYNVLNEITTYHTQAVWKNIEYILKICDKPALLLLMEPAANYTRSRVQPIIDELCKTTRIILKPEEQQFEFITEPLKIEYENDENGLNVKLFRNLIDGRKPEFETSLKRFSLACLVKPLSPITKYEVERQYRKAFPERDEKQRFVKYKDQISFFKLEPDFGNGEIKYRLFGE